jgi:hypothetical protein
VFGHTHRSGPLPKDDLREWHRPPAIAGGIPGARLVNCGCWTYDSIFLSDMTGDDPYWPGTIVVVDDSGPPTLDRLLADRTPAELSPRSMRAALTPRPV